MLSLSQGLFIFSCSANKEVSNNQGQDSWTELTKEIFHTTEHHVQNINWEELARRDQSLLWDGVGIHQWVVNKDIMYHSFFLGFTPLLLLLLLLWVNLFKLLNYSYINPWSWVWPFFQFSFPSYWGNPWTAVSEHPCGTPLLDGFKSGHHIKPFNYSFQ